MVGLATVVPQHAWSGEQASLLEKYARQARQESPDFTVFQPQRGELFFTSRHSGGKPDTPACTTCHGATPTSSGMTRANKPIEPMAISKTPSRFADPDKVEKWFGRNCDSVLGRPCTAQEKGDVLVYLLKQ
ncbi:MAG: DUF1924 domain-containing protein [Magnetococcales bacterium]|nr:DUF1924 domain-containing protein [Magnetococcales bacterium]